MDKLKIGNPRVNLHDEESIWVPNKNILQSGELGATIELIVREGVFDPRGKITEYIGPRKSESFVRQFFEMLYINLSAVTMLNPYPVRDTNNVIKYIPLTWSLFACNAVIGAITSGIVVGTGNTAPTINDYALQTIVLHDAAPPTAGRMQYGAVTFGAPSSDSTISQFTITRNFANASGGSITVNEIGLYVQADPGATPGSTGVCYHLAIRDVIPGGIAVPNGQTLTVNYRPQGVV